MAESNESRATDHGLTVGEARRRLDLFQGYRNEPGINAVGVGIREDGPSIILSVDNQESFDRYAHAATETGPDGMPIVLEIDQIQGASANLGQAGFRAIAAPASCPVGFWERLLRPIRGFSTLFVP